MLTKKFLSLTLATGLAVSASSNVFALGGQSDVAPSPSATQCSTEIMSNITTLLAIRACVIKLSNTLKTISSPEVQAFCQQLKYTQDVNKLAAEFERLYNSDEEFKKVVNEAWVTDATGSKKHASIGVNKMSKETRIRKHWTGFHDSLCKETRIRKHWGTDTWG